MSTDPRPVDLGLDAALAVRVLGDFVADAVESAGAAGVVLGLSGGADSALAAALAVGGLGTDGVHALYLPYRTSSPDSRSDAETTARRLGLELPTIEITSMVDPYVEARQEASDDLDRVRRGNLMARLRMAILFDQAKRRRALVLGTSNKTEILLGYSTIFGDNASSINPLGDLYKTQVWQLARHLELPEAVITKPPSADLWPDQTDEGELGFGYELADPILALYFDHGFTPEEIVEAGYPREVVERIVVLESRNRFKRRLMLIARLSGSAINLDREIPRD